MEAAKKKLLNEEYEEALGKVDACFGTTENHEALLSPPSNDFLNELHFQKCRILKKWGKLKESIESCEDARDHNQANILLSEIYEETDQIDLALKVLKDLLSADTDNDHDTQNIQERINSLEKLARQPRNYYKILGLSKSEADEKTVKKKYKKLAIIYHPDRCGKNSETEGWASEKCEKAFRDIADAKEVLSDPQKRSQFDSGSDPLNPEQDGGNAHFHSTFQGFDSFHNSFDNFHQGFEEFGSFFRDDDHGHFQETFDYHFDNQGFW
jgi:DnaJ family protein C protein 3